MGDFWDGFSSILFWAAGVSFVQVLWAVFIYVGHVKGRKHVMEIVHEVHSPYYDYEDKRSKQVAKYIFPGTTFAVVLRRGYMEWIVFHYMVIDPDGPPLMLRMGAGQSRGWAWVNLSKELMNYESRMFLTRLVLRKTMSPVVMESISKAMKEIA